MFLGQASVKSRSSVGYALEMTCRKAASSAGFERSGIPLENVVYGCLDKKERFQPMFLYMGWNRIL
jgi:hypothetical protein